MSEEEKKAIEMLRTEIDNIKISILGFERDIDDKDWLEKITRELKNDILARKTILNLIETQKAEIEKKDKIISLMAENLTTPINGKEWIIEYYSKLAEEEK